jgi:hypothetical protein
VKRFIQILSLLLGLGAITQVVNTQAEQSLNQEVQSNSKVKIFLEEQKNKILESDYDDETKEDMISIIKRLEIISKLEKGDPGP